MEKKFRDLKKGDSVWIIDMGMVIEAKVRDIISCKYPYFHNYIYTSYSRVSNYVYPGSKRAGNLFINEEDAYKLLRKISEKRRKTLEKKIDSLVSEFDHLDSICQPPTVKPSTKSSSMKELKPGDSVWYVSKVELIVKEVKVKSVKDNIEPWSYGSLEVNTDSTCFKTHSNSTRSLNALYYTDEEQAWGYMLRWKKSRMKTVGKEMEKLMKELEKYEKVW